MPSPSPAPTFTMTRKIRFGHTDPAGIVYYPHYFDMFNGTVEDFFEECVGASFKRMQLEHRVVTPLRHIESDFVAPCRIADRLQLALTLVRLGRTSATLTIDGTVEGSPRFRARLVIVFVSTDSGQPVPPPAEMAERLRALLPTRCPDDRDQPEA
jgi:4-hydroxybenzoyl-CoA thioesterase